MDFFPNLFTAESLMATLLDTKYHPGAIGSSGLFKTVALPGTVFTFPRLAEQTVAFPVETPRGTPGNSLDIPRYTGEKFGTKHYKQGVAIMPDEVLNFANPGTLTRQTIEARRADKVAYLRRSMDDLHEYLRMQILLAPATASDGQQVYGATGAAQTIQFTADATKVRQEIHNKLKLPTEQALDGLTYSGFTVWMSDSAWANLIDSPYITKTYLNTPAAAEMRNGTAMDELGLFGITFKRYRGDSRTLIPAGESIVVPNGVENLFIQAFAPADTMDQVGSGAMGSPYYVEARLIDEGKRGWQMDIQTNVAMLCTRPGAIRRLIVT